MESDDSCGGSSASNSSTSSNNSVLSQTNETEENNPTLAIPAASPQSSTSRQSRPRSRSSNQCANSPRSPLKSEYSSSSSSSSDNEDDDNKSSTSVNNMKNKVLSGRSSSDSSPEKEHSLRSRKKSGSSIKSRQSSVNSSSSSNRSLSNTQNNNRTTGGVNISHEDLSDVSDMESEKRISAFHDSKQSLEDDGTNEAEPVHEAESEHGSSEDEFCQDTVSPITDLRVKLDQKKSQLKVTEDNKDSTGIKTADSPNNNGNATESLEDLVKTHDEDALDFEAEEGECLEVSKDENINLSEKLTDIDADEKKKTVVSGGEENKDDQDLEEGEVSDEDEKRPEEIEPKPVCRFYTRGQCTWGMSCRFLHPGVTDKGNYTMFDLVRPVPVPQASATGSRAAGYIPHTADYHDYRSERPPLHPRAPLHHSGTVFPAHHDARSLISEVPVVVESAWERGLRTAKEMMRKANKRKEQDMDFEDKKMNLTLSPDELEKDSYYLKERGSPAEVVPPYVRHGAYQETASGIYSPPDRFGRGSGMPLYDEVDPYGRTTRYRELPPHRMPQYEDERRVRPTREVIVQRVDPVGRGDEWNDPWMRSKSPGGRGGSRDRGDKRRRDRRSYSSNSSYSSSSSSQSDSSSESSRSPSPPDHRRRYNINLHKSSPIVRRHGVRLGRSPSPTQRRLKRSPSIRHSPPIPKRRGHVSPSPAGDKRVVYSPNHKRKKLSPTLKKPLNEKTKSKHRHTSSSSGSGSSDTSASDSDSDSGSSSTDSSSRSRERIPDKKSRVVDKVTNDRKVVKKAETKKRSPISIEIKKQATVGASALLSPTHSVSSEKDNKKSRREELLKQLRAVEDAIAKKRSKLA